MRRPADHLRLVTRRSDSGPGLARARGALDARLGKILVEVGRLADDAQDDPELFKQLGTAAHALALAQRRVRTTA